MERRRGAVTILLTIAFVTAGDARGAFERLPGPAPGRSGGWVWDWSARRGHDRGARFAVGTPAAVPGLGWSHARGRASISCWRVEVDAYLLGLEDLYRESAFGAWLGRGLLTIGVRGWEVSWKDDARRAGWTLSARAASSVRGTDLDLAAQDLPIGGRQASTPPSRFGGRAEYRASPYLRIGGGVFRDPAGLGCLGCIRWAPIPEISFREVFHAPGNFLESGIELRAAGATIGLWLEPSVELGTRVGISCDVE